MGNNSERKKKRETISTEEKENKRFLSVEHLISGAAIAVSVVTLGFSAAWHAQEMANKTLMFSSEPSFETNTDDDFFTLSLRIEQGSVKKAFWARINDTGIVYESIVVLGTKKNFSVTDRIDLLMYTDTDSYDLFEAHSDDASLEIQPFSDRALIILDSTGQWWIYYFVFSPEISPHGFSYKLSVNENGTETGSYEKDLEKQYSKTAMIDGRLTSVEAISEELERSGIDGSYYFYSESQELVSDNGSVVDSNPHLENAYEVPDAYEIYENIIKIHDDISTLQL